MRNALIRNKKPADTTRNRRYQPENQLLRLFLKLGVFSPEPLDATSRVQQFLFTGKKGMTLGTDFNANILFSRTYFDDVAAGTGNGRIVIIRVNVSFHLSSVKIVNFTFIQLYDFI